jgi:hypothetical protein
LNNITDDYIFKRGRKLSKLIYFAENVDVEISDLETYLQLEDVKDDSEEDSYENSASSEEEVEMRGTDNTGYNTGMVVASATAKGHATSETPFEAESYLSQPTTKNNSNPFQTPQTVTADLQGSPYSPTLKTEKEEETSGNQNLTKEMDEKGGGKPDRYKSKKNKHKISIKNKSKKNIKKKRTIKNKRTIKKKITKRHKKTRKHN